MKYIFLTICSFFLLREYIGIFAKINEPDLKYALINVAAEKNVILYHIIYYFLRGGSSSKVARAARK